MLTRRTNVLFGEEDYLLLKMLSRKRKVAVGSLIREAVRRTFGKKKTNLWAEILSETRRIGKKVKVTPKEWKEFISEGRM